MPYCPRCGVETDPSVRTCPLCSTPIPDLGLRGDPAWPSSLSVYDPAKTYATSAQRRILAFGAVASVLIVAIGVVVASDAVIAGTMTWSRWPTASLLGTLALIGAVLLWPRKPLFWGTAWALITVVLLAVFDVCDGAMDWFPTLGFPLAALTFGLVIGTGIVLSRIRRGYNVLALVYGAAAIELVGIDALVHWFQGAMALEWSIVTSLVLGPLCILFFLFHWLLRRPPELKRIFHF